MLWSRPSRLLIAGMLVMLVAGCGFKPLYRTDSAGDVVPQFSQISIAQPEDRPSQQLRNYLLDSLTPHGEPQKPRYILEYRLTENIGSVFVTRSEEITRNNLQMAVYYTLRDYETGKPVYSQSVQSLASYNLTLADYANLVSEKNARERSLKDIAEQMRLRLGNFFDRRSAAGQPRAQ